MSISLDRILNLEPRAFLAHVKASPYSLSNDVLLVSSEFIKHVFVDSFLLPIANVSSTLHFFYENKRVQDSVLSEGKVEKICQALRTSPGGRTPEQIDNFEKKFLYILQRVSDLSQKIKIGPVTVCYEEEMEDYKGAECFRGYNFQTVIFGRSLTECTEKEIDAVIAHELAHCRRKDTLRDLALNWLVFGTYLIFFRCLKFKHFLVAMMLTKGISAIIFLYMERRTELAADKEGMSYLNSSEGAIQDFHSLLKKNYRIKYAPTQEILQLDPDITLWQIKILKTFFISPEGNNRIEVVPLTERLAQALAFQPNASS